MKERPILFSAPMVRAILDGRKTVTRRVVKPMISGGWEIDELGFKGAGPQTGHIMSQHPRQGVHGVFVRREIHPGSGKYEHEVIRSPYGQPGDRLWVREAHAIVPRTAYAMSDGAQQTLRPDDDHDAAIYREGWERSTGGFRWRPSIHMPRWASRILLEVVSVRAERLQEICEADCLAEGCAGGHGSIPGYNYSATSREHYRWLWKSINGPESWDANPWVWVVEFRRVQP